jgi:hypothetical protein
MNAGQAGGPGGSSTRSWFAVTLLAVGSVGILLLWFGFGGDRAGHAHGQPASSVIAAGAVGSGTAPATTPTAEDSAEAAGLPDEHAAHEASASVSAAAIAPSDESSAASAPEPMDPDAAAADRRQVSLGEAAAGGSDPSTAAPVPVVDKWLDPGAAAVNDGTKKQATGVVLLPAPVVDPSQVLPNGLVNGCVSGYGQGVQCLPTTPPSHAGHGSGQDMSMYWTCAEARTLLPDGITVDTPGTDPLGLDSDKDGTACGAGDR